MAATKYLDYNGLLYFWTLIKNMFAKPSNANPQMDGTASAGSSALYSRGDHVHPSDTSKASKSSTTSAGSYGPSADASPAHGGTFKVPYVTVNAEGIVTGVADKTITLPASGNTDQKVKQNLTGTTDTTKYPLLLKYTGTATDSPTQESRYIAAATLQPSTGTIEATKFKGALEGNADTATAFASAQSVTLTGDVTGTASSTGGWSVATTLANSGVSAGTYKSVTVDAKGRVTAGTNPTTIAGYGITDAYTKTEIDTKLTGGMHYKGSVQTVADLPASGNQTGDFYNVIATGENYAWDGSAWDQTGSMVDLQPITNAEIDTIVAS